MLGKEWGRNLLIIIVAILIVGTSLAAIAAVVIRNPPVSTHNPPLYPNAQQVTSQDIQQSLQGVSGQTYKIVSFQTTANVAAVRTFYSAALSGEGWQLDDPASDIDTQWFIWFTSGKFPAMYTFELTTKARANSGTDVEIRLSLMPGL